MVEHVRARADDGHVALEDIDELGEFVDGTAAEELSELEHAAVALFGLYRVRVGALVHRPELIAPELLSFIAGPFLLEEDRAGGGKLDADGADDPDQREEGDQEEEGEDDVGAPLDELGKGRVQRLLVEADDIDIAQLGNVNVISLHEEPLNTPLAKFVKRSADVFFSGLFLVTLFPLVWLVCAIGIKLSSPGPVFFKQKRTGYEGKEFWCYKFRSMHASADADTKQAVKGDSRVFPFGEFLRKSSIDELPQFINVFRGDMSIIGPRPHMIHHTDIYSDLIGDYMIRHLAKPGITGWAQVNGCRGETKELSEMKDRVEKDIWYIEHWSVELDVSIFLQTVWQILRHEDEKAY